mgnify:CR=1 FL=1
MNESTNLLLELYTPKLDRIVEKVVSFIREFVESAGVKRVIVGLSGGVDSSTTLALLSRAVGPEMVYALILPHSEITPKGDVEDAVGLAKRLGVEYRLIDVKNIFESFKSMLGENGGDRIAWGNMLARIRMTILYYHANIMRGVVCGTGDKSEILLGYYTKYGDGGVDFLPIGDLYKTQVRRIALYLGIPEKIALKPSSPRLWRGQLAERELGFTYDEADRFMYLFVDKGFDLETACRISKVPVDKCKTILRMVLRSEHKRRLPPIPKLHRFTVGLDDHGSLINRIREALGT